MNNRKWIRSIGLWIAVWSFPASASAGPIRSTTLSLIAPQMTEPVRWGCRAPPPCRGVQYCQIQGVWCCRQYVCIAR